MTEASSHADLERLLEVQDLDTAIAQLQHRKATLPERQALASLDAALKDNARRVAEAESVRAELVERQASLDAEIATTNARRESIERRMYSARGASARDLQAMDDEIRHLRQRNDHFEDAELEIMVALEPVDAELSALAAARAEVGAQAEALRGALAASEAEIDDAMSVQLAARAVAAGELPPDLRERYDALRARLGGTGAARLVGNRCNGCHLELPSMEVERIRHLPPGTAATCEQCGRILVPSPGPPRPA